MERKEQRKGGKKGERKKKERKLIAENFLRIKKGVET